MTPEHRADLERRRHAARLADQLAFDARGLPRRGTTTPADPVPRSGSAGPHVTEEAP